MAGDDATQFRREAQECREYAERADNPLDKDAWLRLAADWIKLAQAADFRRENF